MVKYDRVLTNKEQYNMEQILDLYGEEIKRLIFTYTKNWSITEDLTQDVFISVYKNLESFKGNSTLKSWIYSIAINRCKDYLKSWNFKKVLLTDRFPILQSTLKTPESTLIFKNESQELIKRIFSLPIKLREAIILFYYKELTIKEISELLNVQESVVKMRLHRGREKLKLSISEGDWSE